jgi:hypothetical protein
MSGLPSYPFSPKRAGLATVLYEDMRFDYMVPAALDIPAGKETP